MTDSNKRDLKSNTAVAKDMLTNALKCAGGTFVVIDGLDEVEEFERQQFLHCLLDIWRDCKSTGLKICISSRAENDIADILDSKATTIRVDRRNAAGIQAYVKSRYENWMACTDFLSEGRSEIKALLSPISTKSKGMFLYARIVIDNVTDLTNIDDVRRELRVLPDDLDDAYKRVTTRINQLPLRKRDRAKRILGWIGGSPVPLNQYELEQALLVSADYDDAPSVDSSANIVKICGPIVEIVDETPQFVHFTVKEYIFNHRAQFLSESECTMDLLVTCLTYLCYGDLEDDLDEEQLQKNILSGKYRLQVFASSTWFALVKKFAKMTRDKTSLSVIDGLTECLLSERENPNYKPDMDRNMGSHERPAQVRRSLWKGASGLLYQTIHFHNGHLNDIWTSNNAETWAYLDPLTVSNSCARVEALYNKLLCHANENQDSSVANPTKDVTHKSDCVCPKLERHYGKSLYKCLFFSCPRRRDGFETEKACIQHMENHSRPWKCPVKSCDFSTIGFQTLHTLEKHRQRLHSVVRDSSFTHPAASDDEALYPLLYGLVASNDIEEFEVIWSACRHKVERFTEAELVLMAAGQGSLPILQLSLEWDAEKRQPRNEAVKFGTVIHDALQSGNLELVGWILDKANAWGRGTSGRHRDVVVAVLKSDSAEVFDIWLRSVQSIESYSYVFAEELFEKTVLNTAKRFPDQEIRLIESWQQLCKMGKLRSHDLGRALTMVAQTTCSVRCATVLLDLGAPIDYPRLGDGSGGKGFTALRWATKKTSEEAAHFMKFLLLEGADAGLLPEGMHEGTQRIETWLNKSWDDLVRWASEERRKRGDSL